MLTAGKVRPCHSPSAVPAGLKLMTCCVVQRREDAQKLAEERTEAALKAKQEAEQACSSAQAAQQVCFATFFSAVHYTYLDLPG